MANRVLAISIDKVQQLMNEVEVEKAAGTRSPVVAVAKRHGIKESTLRNVISDAKNGKLAKYSNNGDSSGKDADGICGSSGGPRQPRIRGV